MDKFHEQLLTTKNSVLFNGLNVFRYIVLAFGVMYLLAPTNVTSVVIGFVSIALFFVIGFLKGRQYKEYEYVFTNGNLQIDVIYGKKKRKTLLDEEVKNLDDFGKASELNIPDGYEKLNCIPWDKEGEEYLILSSGSGKKKAIFILPDEEILKFIKMYQVRKNWR